MMDLNFMWYVTFGITHDKATENRDKALEKCARSAYHDLSRTLDYSISTGDLETLEKNKEFETYYDFIKTKEMFINEVVRIILGKIKVLLDKPQRDFEDWHEDACNAIMKKVPKRLKSGDPLFRKKDKKGNVEDDAFYYGQAQKWLNMTLKNMVAMGLWDLDEIHAKLHVPVDSYITEAASGLDVGIPHSYSSEVCKFSGESKPWSTWNDVEYIKFQKALREALEGENPIGWESGAWIEIAEKRKQQDKDKETQKREKRLGHG